jgi:hypothetical protein
MRGSNSRPFAFHMECEANVITNYTNEPALMKDSEITANISKIKKALGRVTAGDLVVRWG